VQRFGQTEKHVVEHVFGVGSRAHEPKRDGHERVSISRIEIRQRIGAAVASAPHELRGIERLEHHRREGLHGAESQTPPEHETLHEFTT